MKNIFVCVLIVFVVASSKGLTGLDEEPTKKPKENHEVPSLRLHDDLNCTSLSPEQLQHLVYMSILPWNKDRLLWKISFKRFLPGSIIRNLQQDKCDRTKPKRKIEIRDIVYVHPTPMITKNNVQLVFFVKQTVEGINATELMDPTDVIKCLEEKMRVIEDTTNSTIAVSTLPSFKFDSFCKELIFEPITHTNTVVTGCWLASLFLMFAVGILIGKHLSVTCRPKPFRLTFKNKKTDVPNQTQDDAL